MPGYEPLRARVRDVRRSARPGVLRTPRSLRRADRLGGRRSSATARGYGLASYVDGLQASGRVDEALELVDPSIAAARDLGNPYWIAYALWIAGLACRRPTEARARDLGRGRRARPRARSPLLRRVPRSRRRAAAHVGRRGRPRARAVRHRRQRRRTRPATSRSSSSRWPACRLCSSVSIATRRR